MRRVPLFAAAWLLLAGTLVLSAPFLARHAALLPGCALKRLTGFSCATCGLTRCLLALGQGDIQGALHWHPVAALLILLSPAAAAWDIHRAVTGRPWPALPDHWGARLAVLLGILSTWALQAFRGI